MNAPTLNSLRNIDEHRAQGTSIAGGEVHGEIIGPVDVHGEIIMGRGVQLNAPTSNTLGNVDEHKGQIADVSLSPLARPRDADKPFSIISPQRNTLSVIIRTYKAAVTNAARTIEHSDFGWQRGFYEHVVRDRLELDAVRRYIRDNPLQWAMDRDNPTNVRRLPPLTNMAGYLQDLASYGSTAP